MLKKMWNDTVWSKVIAGVILAGGASAVTYFLHWWPAIGKFLLHGFALFLGSTSTPNWILLLLILLTLPTLVIIAILVWQWKFPPKPTAPTWTSYTTDHFFDLRWRWKYFDDGQICDPTIYCPHCDFQVHPRDVSSYRVIDHIAFQCDSCGKWLGDFQESYSSLESKVKRFIQQKIRNNQWYTGVSA